MRMEGIFPDSLGVLTLSACIRPSVARLHGLNRTREGWKGVILLFKKMEMKLSNHEEVEPVAQGIAAVFEVLLIVEITLSSRGVDAVF